MALSKLPLLLLLLVVIVNVSLVANSEPDDTTTFCYSSFDPKPDYLIYSGDAHTVPGYPFLRLTENITNSRGEVFYSKPVKFWEASEPLMIRKPNILSVFSINIRPPSPFPDPSSESFSFRIESIFDSPVPPPFVSLPKINNNSSSSSIFVNQDPSGRYVRIGINHRGFKSSTGILYGTLKYDGEAARLTTSLSNGMETLTGSVIIDLTLFFTQQVRFGIDAYNVQSVAVHDLLSLYFTSTLVNVGGNGGIKQYV